MTALRLSKRSAHCTWRSPVSIQVARSIVWLWPSIATSTKRMTPKTAARPTAAQVTICEPRSPIHRPKKPVMKAPKSGRKMAAIVTLLALHEVDVFDRDGAAVAEIDHENGKSDRRLRRRHGQDEHGEDLAHEVMQECREGDEVDVDGEQHELDRHQDDDDVLAVQENAEDPEREEDRGDGEVVGETDLQHGSDPLPRTHLDDFERLVALARDLLSDLLPPHALARPQGEHDRADHRDQEDQPRSLEGIDIARIDERAQRARIADIGHFGERCSDALGDIGREDPGTEHQHELD